MRAATYTIAVVPGEQGPAECVVNYFGPGQGGTVEANVDRWRAQMLGADGKPAVTKVTMRTVRGVKVTVVDSAGTYTGMGGPMAGGAKPVSGYRLLGAIAEGRGGNVFFKLTGPLKTIAAQQAAFDSNAGVDPARIGVRLFASATGTHSPIAIRGTTRNAINVRAGLVL
jgi:hypothetical protein